MTTNGSLAAAQNLTETERRGCALCPKGATCAGGDAAPVPTRGYYLVTTGLPATAVVAAATRAATAGVPAFAATDDALRLYRCPYPDACLGGSQCDVGHEGFLCATCASGYRHVELECRKCPSAASALFFVVWVALVILLYLILVAGRFAKEHTRYVPLAGAGTTIGIAVTFVQVTVLMLKYTVGWPSWFRDYLAAVSFVSFNLEAISFECMGAVNISVGIERAFRLFVPAIVFGVYVVGFLVGQGLYLIARGMSEGYARKHPAAALPWPGGSLGGYIAHWFSSGIALPRRPDPVDYVNAFTLFLSYAYLWLLESGLSVFQCEAQPDGISTWKPDPTVQCYGDAWQTMLAGSAVGLLVYGLGVPLLFALALRRHDRNFEADIFVRSEARTRLQAVLWTPYRRECAWWIEVRTMRKLLLAVFIVALSGWADPRTSLLLSALVCVGALALQVWRRPYRHAMNNLVETMTIVATLVLVCCAALYGPSTTTGTAGGSDTSASSTATTAAAAAGAGGSEGVDGGGIDPPSGTLSDVIGAVAVASAVSGLAFALYHVVMFTFTVLAKPPSLDEETVDVTLITESLTMISKRPNAIEAMLNYGSDESRSAILDLAGTAREAAAAFEAMTAREFALERSGGTGGAGEATMLGLKDMRPRAGENLAADEELVFGEGDDENATGVVRKIGGGAKNGKGQGKGGAAGTTTAGNTAADDGKPEKKRKKKKKKQRDGAAAAAADDSDHHHQQQQQQQQQQAAPPPGELPPLPPLRS
jgi:hypothetical protein